jgi:hypothetical protein
MHSAIKKAHFEAAALLFLDFVLTLRYRINGRSYSDEGEACLV